jgi:hypothetical protein
MFCKESLVNNCIWHKPFLLSTNDIILQYHLIVFFSVIDE